MISPETRSQLRQLMEADRGQPVTAEEVSSLLEHMYDLAELILEIWEDRST